MPLEPSWLTGWCLLTQLLIVALVEYLLVICFLSQSRCHYGLESGNHEYMPSAIAWHQKSRFSWSSPPRLLVNEQLAPGPIIKILNKEWCVNANHIITESNMSKQAYNEIQCTKGLQLGLEEHSSWDAVAICVTHLVSKTIFCLSISEQATDVATDPSCGGLWLLMKEDSLLGLDSHAQNLVLNQYAGMFLHG